MQTSHPKTVHLFLLIAIVAMLVSVRAYAQKRSDKRGVSWQITNIEDIVVLSKGVSWYYNWAVSTASSDDIYLNHNKYVDFIPMTWNNGYNRTNLRNFLTTHPNIKYILGFNEPNFKSQSAMTPTQAANAWPEIEAIAREFNLKIVSPAVNYAASNDAVIENGVTYTDPFKYLDDFFAACPNCKVDYVAAHCYMNDPASLSWFVNKFIERYNKPVWLTEFCSWEAKAPLTTSKAEGMMHQRDAMVRKVEFMELNPMVAKYAWFTNRTVPTDKFPFHQLMDINPDNSAAKGVLTELGKVYVNMSSFDSTKYYGVNDTIPACQYMKSDKLKLELNTDIQSKNPIQVAGFEGGAFADYFIDIPKAGNYLITVRMANSATFDPAFLIYINGRYIDRRDVLRSDGISNWVNRSFTMNFEAGKQTFRLQSNGYSGNKIQWYLISEATGLEQNNYINISVSILKDGKLHVENGDDILKNEIFDTLGKCVLSWENHSHISVTGLKNGVYIYKARLQNNAFITRKLSVNN